MEQLRQALDESTSRNNELQKSYDALSRELAAVREELRNSISSSESKDRITSTSPTIGVQDWKSASANRYEQIPIALKQVEKLQQDLSTSTSQLAELQSRYEAQSHELIRVRDELETSKGSDSRKTEELAASSKDLEQLRRGLATSSSLINTLEHLNATKTEELTIARNDLEQLHRDLSAASSLITELQRRCATHSSQLEQWKDSDAAKVKELTAARKILEQLQRELSASSSEIDRLRQVNEALVLGSNEELERLRRELVTSTSRITELQQRDEVRSVELATARQDLEQLRSELSTTSSQLAESLQRYEAQEEKLASAHKDLEELRRESRELTAVRDELRVFQSQTTENQQLYEAQLRALRSTVAERPPQLLAMQRFFTVADTHANKIIIQMLQQLNANVQLIAKNMAECLVEDFQPQTRRLTEEQVSVTQRVTECIGHILTDLLGRKHRIDDVVSYLPIALQACFIHHLYSIISSWTTVKEHNDLINDIYERLQKSGERLRLDAVNFCSWSKNPITETQTTSGRWRSLTRTYIKPMYGSDPNTVISATVARLSDIVVEAGCAASVAAARLTVSSKFKDRISFILSIADKFSKTVGDVISADFNVFVVHHPVLFEEMTMEIDKGQRYPTGLARNEVMCSTHLGLTRRMQLESGKKETSTVVRAKVVLEPFLGILGIDPDVRYVY